MWLMKVYRPLSGFGIAALLLLVPLPLVQAGISTTRTRVPDQRKGAGSRGESCLVDNQRTSVALAPRNNTSLTISPYPRLMWAVPATRNAEVEVKLASVGQSRQPSKLLYSARFPAPTTAGMLRLEVPATVGLSPLQVGTMYRWTVTLVCDPLSPDRNITFNSLLQRVEPSAALAQELRSAQGVKRAEVLAQNGIWIDSLGQLLELRCAEPKNAAVQRSLRSLLQSVELEEVAEQPLLGGGCAP